MRQALRIAAYAIAFTGGLIWHLAREAFRYACSYTEAHPWPEMTRETEAVESSAPGARPRGIEVSMGRVGAAAGARARARVHTVAGRRIVGRSVLLEDVGLDDEPF